MKIAAFNVKNLGMKKINNDKVRKNLIRIVSRYTVVVMLEVRDKSRMVMNKFLRELNKYRGNIHNQFGIQCSQPLGRGSRKERFVFFYRKKYMKRMNYYQYKEKNKDVLARDPFILQFSCPGTAVDKLVLIPVHSKPRDAAIELNALDDVVKHARKKWKNNNIMILGDFNASGPYLSQRKRRHLSIASSGYRWLIRDGVDTTTSNSNAHTYDRIVVFGKRMIDAVVPGSAKAFNFQKAYGLSDAKAKDISDHYPVEVELK